MMDAVDVQFFFSHRAITEEVSSVEASTQAHVDLSMGAT